MSPVSNFYWNFFFIMQVIKNLKSVLKREKKVAVTNDFTTFGKKPQSTWDFMLQIWIRPLLNNFITSIWNLVYNYLVVFSAILKIWFFNFYFVLSALLKVNHRKKYKFYFSM